MHRLSYRPEIDGLRALAVLPVVLFHTQLGFSGGYVGVDVFFVISGFLITSLILSDLDAGTFSLAGFWERRIRRIAPAAAVTVLVSLAVGYLLLLPEDFDNLGRSAVAQAFLAANVFFHADAGYFSAPAETKPLLHFWSLAVEEQFYLLFPLLLFALRRQSRRSLVTVVAVVGVASLAWSTYRVRVAPDAAFYLLPSRAWELALGALLALARCQLPLPERWRAPLGWFGLALIGGSMVAYTAHTPFPGPAALPPCLGTALIIWSTSRGEGWLKRLLSLRPAVWIGGLSYSLYLWHWPVQVYSHYWLAEDSPRLLRLLVVLVSLLLAWLSWRYVEQPFRRRHLLAPRRRLAWALAGTTAATAAVGLAIVRLDGLPQRLPPETVQYAAAYDERPRIEEADVSLADVETDRLTPLAAGAPGAGTILLWGDSHARVVSPAVEALCRQYQLSGYRASRSRTPSVLGWGRPDTRRHNEAVLRWIQRHRPAAVILASRWEATLYKPQHEDRLRETIRAIEATGAAVWLMRQVPFQGMDVPRALARAALVGEDVDEVGVSVAEHAAITRRSNQIIDLVAARLPGVHVLDPVPYLSRDGTCFTEHEGEALYYDRQHLSVSGARLLEPMFGPVFAALRPPLAPARRLARAAPFAAATPPAGAASLAGGAAD